jgi:hypothetical protein
MVITQIANKPTRTPADLLSIAITFAALTHLLIGWSGLSSYLYQTTAPFYDSLSYQYISSQINDQARNEGIIPALISAWKTPSNTALINISAAIFSPISPKGTIYPYLISYYVVFGTTFAYLLWKQTQSIIWPTIGTILFLSLTPFHILRSGILDQRLDFSAACAMGLLGALCIYAWSCNWNRVISTSIGLATAFAVLNRPVMAVSAAFIVAANLTLALITKKITLRASVISASFIALPVLVIALPWLLYHLQYLKYYYLTWNVDAGNASSYLAAFLFNGKHLLNALGLQAGILTLLAFAYLLIRSHIDWLKLASCLISGIIPLLVLTFTKSAANPLVSQGSLLFLILPICCLKNKPLNSKSSQISNAIISFCLVLVCYFSLSTLKKLVSEESPVLRTESIRAVFEIDKINEGKPVLLAGFHVSIPDSVALCYLASQHGLNWQPGPVAAQPAEVGLLNATADSQSDTLVRARFEDFIIKNTIPKANILLLPTSESQAKLSNYLYSHRKMPIIEDIITKSPHFEPRGQTSIGGITFTIYKIH